MQLFYTSTGKRLGRIDKMPSLCSCGAGRDGIERWGGESKGQASSQDYSQAYPEKLHCHIQHYIVGVFVLLWFRSRLIAIKIPTNDTQMFPRSLSSKACIVITAVRQPTLTFATSTRVVSRSSWKMSVPGIYSQYAGTCICIIHVQ